MGSIKDIYLGVWKKAPDFRSRAGRREYWTFTLINLFLFAGAFLFRIISRDVSEILVIAVLVYFLAAVLPGLTVTIRRFHDFNQSGWLLLAILLLPALLARVWEPASWIGHASLMVMMLIPGTASANKYGPPPGSPEPSLETTDPAVLTVDSARRESP